MSKKSKNSNKSKKSIREEALFPPKNSTLGFDSPEDSDSVEIVEIVKKPVPIPSFSVVDLTTSSQIYTASLSRDFSKNAHIDMDDITDLPKLLSAKLEHMAESFDNFMELDSESPLPAILMDMAWKQYSRNFGVNNSPSASSPPSKSSDEEREKDDKEDEDSSFDGCDSKQTVFDI